MKNYPLTFGVFESMRSLNGKIIRLNAHLERLKKGCAALKIKLPVSVNKLKNEIETGAANSGLGDKYIRLSVWLEGGKSGYAVLIKKYTPYPLSKHRKGFWAQAASCRQNENSFLAQVKAIERSLYEQSFLRAKAKGFDEAIILNSRGYVGEGSRSNIFMVKDGELFTPSVECACLDGITRRLVLDLAKKARIKFFETKLTLKDIEDGDEAFLTNSLMGVMPLVSINNIKIGNGKAGKLTKWFIKKYSSLLK
ncbi:MAG: aminotransferase class IV [Candidatus Omnitrophica bacterium]|nr:aminotransferase class IV [Candidatus Omnitrophota bacterium]